MAERDHWSGYSPENTFDDERRERGITRYELRPSARADDDDRSPAFLSPDYDEQGPFEEFTPLRKRRSSISSLILMASCAAAAVAVLFALVSSDAMRDIMDIRASVAGVLSTPPVPAQTKTAQTNPESARQKSRPMVGAIRRDIERSEHHGRERRACPGRNEKCRSGAAARAPPDRCQDGPGRASCRSAAPPCPRRDRRCAEARRRLDRQRRCRCRPFGASPRS